MRRVGYDSNTPENVEVKLKCGAHHEAGHIVVAAVQGLKLRSEGLMIDTNGDGLACYYKQPDATDLSLERIIAATLAGFGAEQRFRKEHSFTPRSEMEMIFSCDQKEARQLLSMLSDDYRSGDNMEIILRRMENASASLVEMNWSAIELLADTLLTKEWEPRKPLKSGSMWSRQNIAKYIVGLEVVSILGRLGIASVCGPSS